MNPLYPTGSWTSTYEDEGLAKGPFEGVSTLWRKGFFQFSIYPGIPDWHGWFEEPLEAFIREKLR